MIDVPANGVLSFQIVEEGGGTPHTSITAASDFIHSGSLSASLVLPHQKTIAIYETREYVSDNVMHLFQMMHVSQEIIEQVVTGIHEDESLCMLLNDLVVSFHVEQTPYAERVNKLLNAFERNYKSLQHPSHPNPELENETAQPRRPLRTTISIHRERYDDSERGSIDSSQAWTPSTNVRYPLSSPQIRMSQECTPRSSNQQLGDIRKAVSMYELRTASPQKKMCGRIKRSSTLERFDSAIRERCVIM